MLNAHAELLIAGGNRHCTVCSMHIGLSGKPASPRCGVKCSNKHAGDQGDTQSTCLESKVQQWSQYCAGATSHVSHRHGVTVQDSKRLLATFSGILSRGAPVRCVTSLPLPFSTRRRLLAHPAPPAVVPTRTSQPAVPCLTPAPMQPAAPSHPSPSPPTAPVPVLLLRPSPLLHLPVLACRTCPRPPNHHSRPPPVLSARQQYPSPCCHTLLLLCQVGGFPDVGNDALV